MAPTWAVPDLFSYVACDVNHYKVTPDDKNSFAIPPGVLPF